MRDLIHYWQVCPSTSYWPDWVLKGLFADDSHLFSTHKFLRYQLQDLSALHVSFLTWAHKLFFVRVHHAKEGETDETTKLLAFPVASFWSGTDWLCLGFVMTSTRGVLSSLRHETEESYCLYETEEDAIVFSDTCSVQTGTSIPRTLFTPFDVFQAADCYHADAL